MINSTVVIISLQIDLKWSSTILDIVEGSLLSMIKCQVSGLAIPILDCIGDTAL